LINETFSSSSGIILLTRVAKTGNRCLIFDESECIFIVGMGSDLLKGVYIMAFVCLILASTCDLLYGIRGQMTLHDVT
jgi:hypothetical protein